MRKNSFLHRNKGESLRPVEEDTIVLYGTTWCGMTQVVKRYLDRNEISYKYLDLEEDVATVNQLRWITGGYTSHPTIVINGQVLIEPDIDELSSALSRNGYL
ncbi:MAG TPA: glutaredoxin family protein [Bacteroidales bacterium]|nr:glutaredoxin family protein [Bacteroidales bacterium]